MEGEERFGATSGVTRGILQICHLELGHNDTLCHNMNSYPNETVQNEVQIFQNEFAIKDRWVGAGPALAYSVFAGALSDRLQSQSGSVIEGSGFVIPRPHVLRIYNRSCWVESAHLLPTSYKLKRQNIYRYGRKPLFVLPVIGSIVGHCFSIINYAFIRHVFVSGY